MYCLSYMHLINAKGLASDIWESYHGFPLHRGHLHLVLMANKSWPSLGEMKAPDSRPDAVGVVDPRRRCRYANPRTSPQDNGQCPGRKYTTLLFTTLRGGQCLFLATYLECATTWPPDKDWFPPKAFQGRRLAQGIPGVIMECPVNHFDEAPHPQMHLPLEVSWAVWKPLKLWN